MKIFRKLRKDIYKIEEDSGEKGEGISPRERTPLFPSVTTNSRVDSNRIGNSYKVPFPEKQWLPPIDPFDPHYTGQLLQNILSHAH